jgi:hypothetical protein
VQSCDVFNGDILLARAGCGSLRVMTEIVVDPHRLLAPIVFQANLPGPLSDCASPDWLRAGLQLSAEAPVTRSEALRKDVRDLLRVGGYKPTGRGKPASEYLVRAASQGKLGPINLLVDACNVVSLHSGVPISVVSLDLAASPLRIGIAASGTRYVLIASARRST